MVNPLARLCRMSLSSQILLGLALGIALGLFVGEPVRVLQPVADIYIRLLQMTVLPYLVTSLIIAFGQINLADAKRIFSSGGSILVVVWIVTAAVLVSLPLALPKLLSAAFFSEALVHPAEPLSLTDLYFTANPFDSLSRNVVPAVVVFSCLLGIGLMALPDKESLLAPMRTWNAAIVRITEFIINLTPIGVFAIVAIAAGTVNLAMLAKLEAYFILFAAAALLLTLWILPLLVTAVTPFSYREVVGIARDALLTAFMTNSAFIVLPILIERSKALLKRHQLHDERSDSAVEVLIPVMFNFPNAGKLLTLLFIPCGAWLSGRVLEADEYASLIAVGIPSYFAKAQVALPFLLDYFGLPIDLFELYLPTAALTGKFDSLATAMNLVVFGLLGAAGICGFAKFDPRRIARAFLAMVVGTVIVVVFLRLLLGAVVNTDYDLDASLKRMHRATLHPDSVVHHSMPDLEPEYAGLAPLQRIRQRGSLRIGYDPNNLPMSFINESGDLVGFDVELSEDLAESLGVRAEFVPIGWPQLPQLLETGLVDVMPGVWFRPYWFSLLRLSRPYFTATMGLAVRDDRRDRFQSLYALRHSSGLKIGVPLDSAQIRPSMEYYFKGSDVEFVTVEFWDTFFRGELPELDGFLLPAEHASAWTMVHPHYTVVVPQPNPVRVPTGFAMAFDAGPLVDVVNEWVLFADEAGQVRTQYEHWILGDGTQSREPRWSIMRNVLGWGRETNPAN
ncbi:cation:dicarboxylate symporter family transporter [Haliea sp. E17]|uniref:cation:dicarboxylate symporter family transporter n=1 Tax=Haliea sp. E17 TaxID=3401576 RepID=UPI003AADF3EE